MTSPDSQLDRHLEALFGGLDTRADFDARLMARMRAESDLSASERTVQARQQEHARYRRAVLELQGWRRSMLRLLTLDTLGIALLLGVVLAAVWPRVSSDVIVISRQYGPYLIILLGVLLAAVPVIGVWAEQARKPIRPL